jgi:hypothetical protein
MDDQPNTPIETAEQEMRRLAQFKQAAFARFEEITGLTFARETGHCTTPGEFNMEGELKIRWESLCNQMGEARDAQIIEQLWREMGKFMREAIQQGETGPTDACAKPDA